MIAIGRNHLDLLIENAHDGDVERAAAKIENENGVVLVQFIEPVSQRSSRWLIDNLENVQTGQLAGGNCGSSLGVIEISRHGKHRIGDGLIEILFGIAL